MLVFRSIPAAKLIRRVDAAPRQHCFLHQHHVLVYLEHKVIVYEPHKGTEDDDYIILYEYTANNYKNIQRVTGKKISTVISEMCDYQKHRYVKLFVHGSLHWES